MTTNQLTKLKDAGFTLEQIIRIGEIFDPVPKPEKAPDIKDCWKDLAESRPPRPPVRRPKDFDPTDPAFIRQIERINRQRENEGLLCMDSPIQSNGGHARAASLSAERRSEIAKKAAQARWGFSITNGIDEEIALVKKFNEENGR